MRKWGKNGVKEPKITVIIAVYNKPDVLELCLEAYRQQNFSNEEGQNFEILMADDGSQPEIEKIFQKFSKDVPFACTYLYQEDTGWGKIRMLNWAILEAQSDFLIFTDGDCIPHPRFIQAHYEGQKEKTVLCGRRVDLMEEISQKLTLEDIKNGKLNSPFWILRNMIENKMDFGEQGLYFPSWLSGLMDPFSKHATPTLLGSNFSIHKKWLREVNGFDESYQSPGLGEDTDIERRFHLCGLKLKWITHRAIQYHVWHSLTEVGQQSRKTYELHQQKGNVEALLGLRELEGILNQK